MYLLTSAGVGVGVGQGSVGENKVVIKNWGRTNKEFENNHVCTFGEGGGRS